MPRSTIFIHGSENRPLIPDPWFLLQEYDIAEPLRIQAFDKELRRKIVLACLEQGAGFRQLSRLTGVPYGVIHRIFERK